MGLQADDGGRTAVQERTGSRGYPVLLLDGDGCDRANTMDGQTATRLDAFLEMLHSKQEALV